MPYLVAMMVHLRDWSRGDGLHGGIDLAYYYLASRTEGAGKSVVIVWMESSGWR